MMANPSPIEIRGGPHDGASHWLRPAPDVLDFPTRHGNAVHRYDLRPFVDGAQPVYVYAGEVAREPAACDEAGG